MSDIPPAPAKSPILIIVLLAVVGAVLAAIGYKFRKEIEGVASGKYDRGELEADGRTVVVTATDIKTRSPLRPRQLSNQDN